MGFRVYKYMEIYIYIKIFRLIVVPGASWIDHRHLPIPPSSFLSPPAPTQHSLHTLPIPYLAPGVLRGAFPAEFCTDSTLALPSPQRQDWQLAETAQCVFWLREMSQDPISLAQKGAVRDPEGSCQLGAGREQPLWEGS